MREGGKLERERDRGREGGGEKREGGKGRESERERAKDSVLVESKETRNERVASHLQTDSSHLAHHHRY